MTRPDVTVVIPCYNAERWVGRAIQSALDQEGVAVEVIVVDDGSTDGSLHAIKSFGDRIRWEAGPNQGACAARNRGLALAEAPYVMFLDADDYLDGPFLKAASASLEAAGADMGFGPLVSEHETGRRVWRPRSLRTHRDALAMLCEDHFVPPCATVWRTRFVRAVGGWSHGIRRNQDLELTFRALGRRPAVASWHEGAGVYFQHAEGRISGRNDPRTVEDQIAVLARLCDSLDQAGVDAVTRRRYVHAKAYQLCRMMARADDPESYRLAVANWRALGGIGHRGTWSHVLGATLLGLRTKERLAARFAEWRVPSPRRPASRA